MTKFIDEEINATLPSSQFCQACQKIFQSPLSIDADTEHLSAAECHKAGVAGCALCFQIWQHATKHGQTDVLALLQGKGFTRYTIESKDRYDSTHLLIKFSFVSLGLALGHNFSEALAEDKVEFVLEPLNGF